MQLETFSWAPASGWSIEPLPALDSEQTLVVAFGAPRLDENPAPLAALLRAWPRARVIGCSTSGEIHGAELRDGSVTAAVVRFERTRLAAASAQVRAPEGSFAAGSDLGRALAGEGLRAVLVLSDGLGVNGSELVRGLDASLPGDVVVTGGLAGDGDRFQRTWILDRDGPRSGVVTAVGLYGPSVRIGHGSQGGWDIFGPERVVTRSRQNVLFELDGRPALELYKGYLGERAAGLPATALLFPLALRPGIGDAKVLVRTVLSIDETEQSMTFAGDVPQGHLAQLMRANFERLIDGASQAALHTRRGSAGDGPVLSIAISCVGRRLILGQRTEEEIEAVLEELPAETGQVGFYSYGEISPHASGSRGLHNQTMTLTTIAEAPEA